MSFDQTNWYGETSAGHMGCSRIHITNITMQKRQLEPQYQLEWLKRIR